MENLHIEIRKIESLIPYARNARTHSEEQISQIAASIREFGWTNPILIDDKDGVVAGHGRLLAARKLGLAEVPVIELRHLTPLQIQAYVIADNKLAENAGWDEELLKIELSELKLANFDVNLLGFDEISLDDLLNTESSSGLTDDDAVPEIREKQVSRKGDIFILCEHKILCGDATITKDYQQLLGNELADMTFTDPPYNVNYGSTMKDKIRKKYRPIKNDYLGENFRPFLLSACKNVLSVTKGSIYICMSSSELDTLQSAFREAGGHWSTFVIWAKNSFTMGRSDYQRQYEPILYGWPEKGGHYWCGARDQGDVWFINRSIRNDLHPTQKPVELIEKSILNSSKRRDIILDPFAGSGTTIIACEKTGRRARVIELDPRYVDVSIRRWQEFTGKEAIRVADSVKFNDLSKSEVPHAA